MVETTVEGIREQLDPLTVPELGELRKAIDERLALDDHQAAVDAFNQSLLEAGVISKINKLRKDRKDPPLIKISGPPLSQTVIEDRR